MNDPNFIMPNEIPEHWREVSPPALVTPPPHEGYQDFLQGTISTTLQRDTALANTKYKSAAGVPQTPLMPIGPGATAQVNASTQSIVKVFSQTGSSGPQLQTNGIDNPVQTKLDLEAGSNISLQSDSTGRVTITGTGGGGDGLTHGDAIWEIDPAYILIRDDFIPQQGGGSFNSGGLTVSGLNWSVNLSSGVNSVILHGGTFPQFGIVCFTNGSTSNDTNKMMAAHTGTTNGFPLLDYPGWKFIWIFKIARNQTFPPSFSWSKVSFYLGMASFNDQSINNTSTPRPPYFLGLRYDTDPTSPAISDTTFKFEYVSNLTSDSNMLTRNNTQGTVFDTGITVTENRTYRFEMSCLSSGQIVCFLTDGVNTSNTTLSISRLSSTVIQPSYSLIGGGQIVRITWSGTGGDGMPIVLGTQVNISGSTLGNNGTYINNYPIAFSSQLYSIGTLPGSTGSDSGATTSFYPGLLPYFAYGNDTEASPTASSHGVEIDYFGLVWNKGLISGGATPNSVLARYW